MTTFADLGIHPDIISALEALGFTAPTPVQEQIIPILLEKPVDIVRRKNKQQRRACP